MEITTVINNTKIWLKFNQPIENLQLPSQLRILGFNGYFNHPIENVQLPSTLTALKFGYEFKQPINNLILPQSLLKLELSDCAYFDQPISNILSHNPLQYLSLPTS